MCRGELAWYTDSSRVHALEDSLVDLTPSLAGTARLLRSVVLPKVAGLAAPVADRILVRSGSNLHFDVPRALGKEPRFTCLSVSKCRCSCSSAQGNIQATLQAPTAALHELMCLTALLPAPMPSLTDASMASQHIKVRAEHSACTHTLALIDMFITTTLSDCCKCSVTPCQLPDRPGWQGLRSSNTRRCACVISSAAQRAVLHDKPLSR